VALRLAAIEQLITQLESLPPSSARARGRNFWTRMVDAAVSMAREYIPPLHWLGMAIFAAVLFIYARLCALTVRLRTTGKVEWPDMPAPCVLALWHACAPSLLVASAVQRPRATLAILVAGDPRGDSLSLLCKLLGLRVVRVAGPGGGWEALANLAGEIEQGACAIVTADGGGPARVAKVGAMALSSATGAPLFAVGADCYPALGQPHKWDSARTPLPFSRVAVVIGESLESPVLTDLASIEDACRWLQLSLDDAVVKARHALSGHNSTPRPSASTNAVPRELRVEEFRQRPLRVHSFLADVPLRTLERIELCGGRPGMTLKEINAVIGFGGEAEMEVGPVTNALFRLRTLIGRLLGWDEADELVESVSYVSRLSADDRDRSLVPPSQPAGISRILYQFENEMLAEIINRTVHCFWVMASESSPHGYSLHLAVYVKRLNWFTPIYMTLVSPLLKWIIYPSMTKGIRQRWEKEFPGSDLPDVTRVG
jgi:lysophospholipid acyltransferase (LPLAT)-like uncharacterized protein